MFTRLRLQPFQSSGDWKKDGPQLVRWITDHFLSLEPKGALAINRTDTWTPAITFATSGDLAVTYSVQIGRLVRMDDKQIAAFFRLDTSAFTHTTASGVLSVTGLPTVAAAETSMTWPGSLVWGGITKAGYTQVTPRVITGEQVVKFIASGSGVATSAITAADMPTGGSVVLIGSVVYEID